MTHTHYRTRVHTRYRAPPPTECNLVMSRPPPNLVRLCRPDYRYSTRGMSADPTASSIKIIARLLFALVALLTSACLMGEAAQSAEASSKELLCAQGGYCSVGKVGRWSESAGHVRTADARCMVSGRRGSLQAAVSNCSAGKVGVKAECARGCTAG